MLASNISGRRRWFDGCVPLAFFSIVALTKAPETYAQAGSGGEVALRDASIAVFAPQPVAVTRDRDAIGHTLISGGAPALAMGVGTPSSDAYANALRALRPQASDAAAFQKINGGPAPWFAPIASLIVPGSGQAALKQQRSVAYLVAEAFLVIRSVQSYRDDQNARTRYRALASNVARVGFGAIRPDGPWEYYEEMEKYESSGIYNSGTAGQFIPEPDASTFNGMQWELARQQFWADPSVPPPHDSPEYIRALDFYRKRAVQGSFQWSWRDHQLEQSAFRETIKESNSSNQRYITGIAFVGVNHLVSLVDAYVTVRLRRYGGAGLASASVSSQILPMGVGADRGYGMAMNVTVPVGGRR